MNKLNTANRAQVLRCLVEGASVRSTVRMTGVAKNTILKLLVDIGPACWKYMDDKLTNLNAQRVQCNKIWSFVGCKEKNVPEAKQGTFGVGDVWTWVAIDADTKLIITWTVGARDTDHACAFMEDLVARLANRVQLTTDGFKSYLQAVGLAFEADVDYAMLVKQYGTVYAGGGRHSPPECIGAKPHVVRGNPDPEHISTSFSERQNLTIRMGMRRFTRQTDPLPTLSVRAVVRAVGPRPAHRARRDGRDGGVAGARDDRELEAGADVDRQPRHCRRDCLDRPRRIRLAALCFD